MTENQSDESQKLTEHNSDERLNSYLIYLFPNVYCQKLNLNLSL